MAHLKERNKWTRFDLAWYLIPTCLTLEIDQHDYYSKVHASCSKGFRALQNGKFDRASFLVLFQPSIASPLPEHPRKALETSPRKTPFKSPRRSASNFFFYLRRMHVCWFMRTLLCGRRNEQPRRPFPTYNLNISRVCFTCPSNRQVCSDAEEKEDDTYQWPLIFTRERMLNWLPWDAAKRVEIA